MSDFLIDAATNNPNLPPMSDEQRTLIAIMQGHVKLQDQFAQITKHIETIYSRLKSIEQVMHNKVLS